MIAKHIKYCFGSSVHISEKHRPDLRKDKAGKKAVQMFYEHGVVDMIWHAGRHAHALDDRVALVFAKHPNFSLSRLEDHFGEFQAVDPRLHTVTIGKPQDVPQLQAADLIAYEVKHFHQDLDLSMADRSKLKAPLRTLIDAGVCFGTLEWLMTPPALSRKVFLLHPPPDWD